MLKVIGAYIINYIRLIAFAASVLIGVQIPSFIGQYQSVVSAHLSEARQNLVGFQQTASRYFDGDISKLIQYYRQSSDQVFISDADNIQAIVERVSMLTEEAAQLNQHPLFVFLHVSSRATNPLFTETLSTYTWTVPLNALAVFWGLGFAVLIVLLFDILTSLGKRGMKKRNSKTAKHA